MKAAAQDGTGGARFGPQRSVTTTRVRRRARGGLRQWNRWERIGLVWPGLAMPPSAHSRERVGQVCRFGQECSAGAGWGLDTSRQPVAETRREGLQLWERRERRDMPSRGSLRPPNQRRKRRGLDCRLGRERCGLARHERVWHCRSPREIGAGELQSRRGSGRYAVARQSPRQRTRSREVSPSRDTQGFAPVASRERGAAEWFKDEHTWH